MNLQSKQGSIKNYMNCEEEENNNNGLFGVYGTVLAVKLRLENGLTIHCLSPKVFAISGVLSINEDMSYSGS